MNNDETQKRCCASLILAMKRKKKQLDKVNWEKFEKFLKKLLLLIGIKPATSRLRLSRPSHSVGHRRLSIENKPKTKQGTLDISLASQSTLLSSSWTSIKSTASDNLPILIELPLDNDTHFSPKKTHINFLRADWRQFTADWGEFPRFEIHFSNAAGKKYFKNLVLKAARHHIHAGCHCHYNPSSTPRSAPLTAKRDRGRHNN